LGVFVLSPPGVPPSQFVTVFLFIAISTQVFFSLDVSTISGCFSTPCFFPPSPGPPPPLSLPLVADCCPRLLPTPCSVPPLPFFFRPTLLQCPFFFFFPKTAAVFFRFERSLLESAFPFFFFLSPFAVSLFCPYECFFLGQNLFPGAAAFPHKTNIVMGFVPPIFFSFSFPALQDLSPFFPTPLPYLGT